jgi:hypothetical protein
LTLWTVNPIRSFNALTPPSLELGIAVPVCRFYKGLVKPFGGGTTAITLALPLVLHIGELHMFQTLYILHIYPHLTVDKISTFLNQPRILDLTFSHCRIRQFVKRNRKREKEGGRERKRDAAYSIAAAQSHSGSSWPTQSGRSRNSFSLCTHAPW